VALCEKKCIDKVSRWVMVMPLVEHHTKTQRDGEMKGSGSGKIFVHVVFESIGWGKENKLIIIDPPILL